MADRKRILFVSRKSNYAGAVRVLWDIIRLMDRNKFEVHLLIDGKKGEAIEELSQLDIQLHYLPIKKELKLFRGRTTWTTNTRIRHKTYQGLLNHIRPHIIYFNTNGNTQVLEWSKAAQSTVICHLHGVGEGLTQQGYDKNGQPKKVNSQRQRITKQIPDYYVACSCACKQVLIQQYQIDTSKVHYFPESVNPQKITANSIEVKNISNQYKQSSEEILIACIGNFHFRKGPDVLFRAFALALKQYPNIRLLWVGNVNKNLSTASTIQQIIEDNQLANKIHFLGHRNNVYDYITASDIFILCSRDECLPLSILEAMKLKSPGIATDVGGVSEAIIDENTGILAPSEDIQAISNAIIRLAKNPELRSHLAKNAAQILHEKYDVQPYVNDLEKFLQNI